MQFRSERNIKFKYLTILLEKTGLWGEREEKEKETRRVLINKSEINERKRKMILRIKIKFT